jgi:uncharacterized cofD-like protein
MTEHHTSQLPLPPSFGGRRRPSAGGRPPAPAVRGQAAARPSGPSVVALGGGHGLSASLTALRHVAGDLTAVVTVADDGGSSGTIRREMDVLPPGDLRMALAALCDDTDWGRTWAAAMQHRFHATRVPAEEATLENHALGNLLIVALWELLGDPVDGLLWAGALLRADGRVLPASRTPLTIAGTVLTEVSGALRRNSVEGQVALAEAAREGKVLDVRLIPEDAEPAAEALEAVAEADVVVLGPGSLYTSVLPHLLMPGMRESLAASGAKKVYVTNLHTGTQETTGMTHADQLRVIRSHAPDLRFDAIIACPRSVGDREDFEAEAAAMGAQTVFSRVSRGRDRAVHDPLLLAVAFEEAMHRIRHPRERAPTSDAAETPEASASDARPTPRPEGDDPAWR